MGAANESYFEKEIIKSDEIEKAIVGSWNKDWQWLNLCTHLYKNWGRSQIWANVLSYQDWSQLRLLSLSIDKCIN